MAGYAASSSPGGLRSSAAAATLKGWDAAFGRPCMGPSDGPVLDRVLDLVADESPSRFAWSFLAGAKVRERNRLGVCCFQVILQQVAVQHCNTEHGCSSETKLPNVASAVWRKSSAVNALGISAT